MFRILLLLFFISLPLFAANILSYKIHNNETQNIEITLSLDDEWKGFVEQKNTNEEMVFIFKGLRIKSPAQKLQNFSDTEYAELIQPNADESQLILKSEQMFDATISNKMNEIHISLTPKSAPLTIEGIANSANYGSITAYILDVLLYIVIFLAAVSAAFFIFVKFKLFSRTKAKDIETENSILHIEKIDELLDKNTDEIEDKSDIKDDKTIKSKKSRKTKTQKPSTSQKKLKQTKSLFDL